MKTSLFFDVSARPTWAPGVNPNLSGASLEVVCVFGKPTADQAGGSTIPLTIKEMLLNGRLLGYTERQLMVTLLGGEETISRHLKAI